MLSGVSFVIFAIVFGILVDRFDHINAQIDKFVNFYPTKSYPRKKLFDQDLEAGNYLINESLTRKCIQECYTKGFYFSYMKPNEDIYKTIISDFGANFNLDDHDKVLGKKINEL